MKKIGIIGFGNMGQAIAERAKSLYEIIVFDKDVNKTKDVGNINVVLSNIDLIGKVEAIILAVKPQEFENLLNDAKFDRSMKYFGKKISVLNLKSLSTPKLSKEIGDFTELRELELLSTNLQELPNSIGNLQKLKKLKALINADHLTM